MRRLFPLALLLLACPHEKQKVGDPIDASVPPPNGWLLTQAKVDAYLSYQKLTLVHLGLEPGDVYDGGALRKFEDRPEAHADFDEWARTTNGLTEDEVKKLDEMMGPLTAATLLELTPTVDDLDNKVSQIVDKVSEGERQQLEQNAAMMKGLNRAKQQLGDLKQRYGDENVKVLLSRRHELVRNWLKLMNLRAPTPALDGSK